MNVPLLFSPAQRYSQPLAVEGTAAIPITMMGIPPLNLTLIKNQHIPIYKNSLGYDSTIQSRRGRDAAEATPPMRAPVTGRVCR